MKNIIFIIGLVFPLFQSASLVSFEKENLDTYKITLSCDQGVEESLICSPFCAFGIEKRIREAPYVQGVKIDMASGVLEYKIPVSQEMTKIEIQAIYENSGFKVTRIEIDLFNK